MIYCWILLNMCQSAESNWQEFDWRRVARAVPGAWTTMPPRRHQHDAQRAMLAMPWKIPRDLLFVFLLEARFAMSTRKAERNPIRAFWM